MDGYMVDGEEEEDLYNGRTKEEYLSTNVPEDLELYDMYRSPRIPEAPDSDSGVAIDLSRMTTLTGSNLNVDLTCPVCLGILTKTTTVKVCLHRFCASCIEKCLRIGKRECPTCRVHISSRRMLRSDPTFDKMVKRLFPNVEAYEEHHEKLVEQSNKKNNLTKGVPGLTPYPPSNPPAPPARHVITRPPAFIPMLTRPNMMPPSRPSSALRPGQPPWISFAPRMSVRPLTQAPGVRAPPFPPSLSSAMGGPPVAPAPPAPAPATAAAAAAAASVGSGMPSGQQQEGAAASAMMKQENGVAVGAGGDGGPGEEQAAAPIKFTFKLLPDPNLKALPRLDKEEVSIPGHITVAQLSRYLSHQLMGKAKAIREAGPSGQPDQQQVPLWTSPPTVALCSPDSDRQRVRWPSALPVAAGRDEPMAPGEGGLKSLGSELTLAQVHAMHHVLPSATLSLYYTIAD
ncbi:unnamed protein product [Vitrella brassicaformis CCMP3155]|uniref:RING-type E3 ubiquitin transferase n=1 Tax=Vitrella brassicaformis (strain CCMP3155) TaxID=1169540 RepID=A0A0G4GWC7_VITBC|nr:unnamed protein product [Vitrella brassicaformis CCMP3155]|eukprot:CEM35045.1 unnamed protein product [Vitrella brassicaformis CCMP3155]